jgi:ABC-type phosphate/phosphonate transport system substrate-binding protein
MPCVKLERKERNGSKIKKYYTSPLIPYRRVFVSQYVNENSKARLAELFATLNPIELRRQITAIQESLYRLSDTALMK